MLQKCHKNTIIYDVTKTIHRDSDAKNLLFQGAIELMRDLQDEGDAQFKTGRYSDAFRNYKSALEICEAHRFEESAAKLHSKVAAVYLKCNHFEAASHHAEKCIALDPDFAKVVRYIVNFTSLS